MVVRDKGNINLASLIVDDIYVVVNPPSNSVIPGIPTDIAGIVGTASRGPMNQPIFISTPADLRRNFGDISTDKFDLVTEALMAMKQGANNLVCVRVGDGTEVKASGVIKDNAGTPATMVTVTAKTPGTWGNSLKVIVGEGTGHTVAAPKWRVTVELPGEIVEDFDNISAATGPLLAAAIVSAINNGQSGVRGPSNLVTASTSYAGAATGLTKETVTISGGTNGLSGVDKVELIGVDGESSTRTGMYALRGTKHRQFILAGLDDSTAWTDQLTFAKEEGSLCILTKPTGTASQAFIDDKKSKGIEDYHAMFVKDWLYVNDSFNKLPMRLVSPLGAALGRVAVLSPEQNPGNKEINGIIATERTRDGVPYSSAELNLLERNGIAPITNPIPRGNIFGLRHGQNASNNPDINGVNYNRMTNFLAYSLDAVLGKFVCEPHTLELRRQVVSAISAFLSNLQRLGMIGDPNGGLAFTVKCDATNNPDDQVAQGYLFVEVKVRYLSTVRFFVVGLEGGQTVRPIVKEA